MRSPAVLIPLVLAAFLPGCKVKPAKPAGFVRNERMTKPDDLPFHSAWRNPDRADLAGYDRVRIAPVDTAHLLEMDWWQKGEAGAMESFKKDVEKIAVEVREMLEQAFREPPEGTVSRYAVVDDQKGKGTLILEVAIVEIVPSKVVLQAASWAMPFGTGVLLTPLNTSTAAMEGRFRDAATGEVLLEFADREGEKARPLDLAGFTWYAHAKGIMRDWALQLVQVANQKPGEQIPDTKVYTLVPW